MIVEMEHPLGGKMKHVGNPVKMPEIEGEPLAPPTLGQHNEEILVGLLKCSSERIKMLEQETEKRTEELLASLRKTQ
jgi:crotonobetainyl-CoA:carnitine CoA-transferase CaiB-like acyl-CoA transferase